ncbi:hypothetical protein ACFVHB_29925 [Kitasatospora sp. NPDC127111]|uniref:hypothetical protein n=1 Tax=Kitasatospora sp. NPDC127111 TaxID=3345363 RepID=UPI003625E3EE
MAKKLTALSDLESFGQFDDITELMDGIKLRVKEINEFNTESAGRDDIGKNYHAKVDKPTENLTDLLNEVRKTLDSARKGGKHTSNLLNNADQDAKDSV